MIDGDEVRVAAHVTTTGASNTSSWSLKLPFLCARPGNVGVQIDAFRSMCRFDHPRCSAFTDRFLGRTFESASMDNYTRVLERTGKRARIVEDRLARLRAREQAMRDDTTQRQQRRRDREAARERTRWLHHQSRKQRAQQQREDAAATTIQRYVRGLLARRECIERQQQAAYEHAAHTLQRSLRRYLARMRCMRQQLKERQIAAATVLQRQTRKRQKFAMHTQREKRETFVAIESPRPALPANARSVSSRVSLEASASLDLCAGAPALARHVSLDLLFSDDDDGSESSPPLHLPLVSPAAAPMQPSQPSPMEPLQRPKRPMAVKRVGGGFRATSFAPVKPAASVRVHPDERLHARTQPSVRRFVESEQLTRTAKQPAQRPLARASRRPSVPSSPHIGVSSCRRGIGSTGKASAPSHTSLAAAAALLVNTKDADAFALEELVEAYARSHVDAERLYERVASIEGSDKLEHVCTVACDALHDEQEE